MRITNLMLHEDLLRSLSANAQSLQKLQEQVSTGRQLVRPSDDPAHVREAIKLHDAVAALQQYSRNADSALRHLDAASTALSSAGDAVQRVRELAVQGATGSLSAENRQAMAVEVQQLAEHLVQLAAARDGDAYVFSGYRTDVPPFASPAGTYQGDTGAVLTRVAPGTTMQVNVDGQSAFGAALAALEQLRAQLATGQQVNPATITAIDHGLDDLNQAQAVVGSRQNRLESIKAYLEDNLTSSQGLLSNLEDVDLTSAITHLSERQLAYEAALKVSANIMNTSLLDYLR